jgi:hypothetical protein
MKTKAFLLICLFMGVATIQIYGQPTPPNNKNGTGTVEYWDTWDGYWIPVYSSNGDQIDKLAGTVTYHNLDHFQNGVWVWRKQIISGEIKSVGLDGNGGTGEVFRIKDVWQWQVAAGANSNGHVNALGDQGSHYIITYLYNVYEDLYSCVKAVCPGNDN